ncbi:hypothetical protein K438DRAFT_1773726 [Mycena galopus ATCC 62051]|nr:hypothetical protein K438DRAFT_1773726 [Mycena galopus ATCC 62051]
MTRLSANPTQLKVVEPCVTRPTKPAARCNVEQPFRGPAEWVTSAVSACPFLSLFGSTWEGDGGDAHGLGGSTERSADGLSEGRRSAARGGDFKDSLEVHFYNHTQAEWCKAAAFASGGGDNCGRLCISCMYRSKATLRGFGVYEQGVDHVKKLSYWKYEPITMRIGIRELEHVGFHKCVAVSGFREPLSKHKF